MKNKGTNFLTVLFVVSVFLLPIHIKAQDGSLDKTFGSNGIVTTDFSESDAGFSVIVQPDGKIIVAGTSVTGFAIARYNSNGSLDNTFGVGGKQETSFKDDIHSELCTGGAAVLQTDGKILMAGDVYFKGQGLQGDFAVLRYNSNGTLDTTFGKGGKVTTNVSNYENHAYAIAVQADGKILVAGDANGSAGTHYGMALVRYNTDGSLDKSFNANGIIVYPLSVDSINYATAYTIAIQKDGKILIAGGGKAANGNITLLRFNNNGSIDNSFGNNGKVVTEVANTELDIAYSMVLQSDNKIVVVGTTDVGGTNSNIILLRYNANGSPDNTFGTNGMVITDVDTEDAGTSVVVQPDGKIIAVGASNGNIVVLRFNNNGSLDKSFNNNGKVITTIGGNSAAISVALQPDHKIVIAGLDNDDFVVARYNNSITSAVDEQSQFTTSTWCSPNPATEIITITTPPSLENSTGIIRYSVVNLQGEEVMHTESDSKNISIPIHDFVSGVYTIVATCGMQRTTTMCTIAP
ncbi:MAG: T9SS type A sorting domain-containing protein [Candidatus Kapaibacterium sp.]|nr:T9SS type A sorting domain-containing protein [Bacteroidota bacterium]